MKKVLWVVLLVAVMAMGTHAYAFEVGGQTVDLDLGTTYVTKYIFRGVDTFADDDGGIQPYTTLTFHPLDANLAIGFWGSYALADGHENADEQDYWISLDRDFFDLINLGTGYTYYDFYNADSVGDINEFQWWATLLHIPLPGEITLPYLGTWDKIPVSVGYYAAYAFGNDEATSGGIDNGWYHAAKLGMEFPIPMSEKLPMQGEGMTLTYDQTFGFYDGQLGFDSGFHYWTQSVGTSFALPYNMSLSPSLNYQLSDGAGVNTEDEFYFTLDLSASF